jgi:hypothetical protein
MFRRFLSPFFSPFFSRSKKSTASPRVAPCHADGKRMSSKEKHVWAMMQKGVDRHWEKIVGMGKADQMGFPPGRYFREEFMRVYGGSWLVLVCPSGEWEATLSPTGEISVPRRIGE